MHSESAYQSIKCSWFTNKCKVRDTWVPGENPPPTGAGTDGWEPLASHSGRVTPGPGHQYYIVYAGHPVPPSWSLMPASVQWSNWSLTRTNIIVTQLWVKLTPRKQNLRLWPSHSLEPDNIKTGDFDIKWRSNDNAAAQSGVKTGKWAKVGDNPRQLPGAHVLDESEVRVLFNWMLRQSEYGQKRRRGLDFSSRNQEISSS